MALDIISKEEQARLKELEAVIEQDIKGFVRVGMALKEIKEQGLYRAKYETWPEYCKKEWDLGKAYVNYQIQASGVIQLLSSNSHHGGNSESQDGHHGGHFKILPINERQTRPLTALPMAQQITAWQTVVEKAESTNSKVTAALVERVVQEILEKKVKEKRELIRDNIAKEVEVPDDFSEVFSNIIDVIDHHRQSGWKDFKRKKALEYLKQLEEELLRD